MMEKSIKEELDKMQTIQRNLLHFIDESENIEENCENFNQLIYNQQILEDKHEFKLLLHLLCSISNNHHRGSNFFTKIEKILQLFEIEITNNFSNNEIFNIFKSNKRILLFLIEEKIMVMNQAIAKEMTLYKYRKMNYIQYFFNEIKPFFDLKGENIIELFDIKDFKEEIPEDFNEKRENGENHTEICKLIQNDSIEDFIIYVNKNCTSLKSDVITSIYETNNLLMEKNVKLIEYAAFYGSVQIFNYLRLNGCEMTGNLWIYAIHGDTPELFHILEENNILPPDESYKKCYYEAIKCQNNDIANYIDGNYLENEGEKSPDTFLESIKHYNFDFINESLIDKDYFYQFCCYDYYSIVKNLLKVKDVDVNKKKI